MIQFMNYMLLVTIMEDWEEDTILHTPKMVEGGMTTTIVPFARVLNHKLEDQEHTCYSTKESKNDQYQYDF